MNILSPPPETAESQTHAHLILHAHVLHRGLIASVPIGALSHAVARYRQPTPPPQLLRSLGRVGVAATVLSALATEGRMWGRDEIEWQDRAWRLLHSKGQCETDVWGGVGMVLGGVAGVLARLPPGGGGGGGGGRAYTVVAGAAAGGIVGIAAMLGYRGVARGDVMAVE